MTVSLDGWAIEFGAKFLFLECGLLLKGIEGAARVSLALVGLPHHVSFHFIFIFVSNTLQLCCCFFVSVASTGPVRVRATSHPSDLHVRSPPIAPRLPPCSSHLPSKMRGLDGSLWFREIYGGMHAFGREATAVA
jgi:hypothetical protein